jgi:hypothetical protein
VIYKTPLHESLVANFPIKGLIKDKNNIPINGVKIFAMDSDQQFFEDHNDDLLGAAWVKQDGSFEISFSSAEFSESPFEGKPDIYFVIRNSSGEVIHTTEIHRGIKLNTDNSPFEIVLDALEKPNYPEDRNLPNQDRILSAFGSLGDTASININEIGRTFSLLNSSINAWMIYTQPSTWKEIGYDGPQVPVRPRDEPHKHKLSWEAH